MHTQLGTPGAMFAAILRSDRIRDLSPHVLGDDGRMRVLPAEFWRQSTPAERGLFGLRHGVYGFPTTELVEHLRQLIDGRRAIEIGAGHGVLADALGIVGTDSRQQEDPQIRRQIVEAGQVPVRYGPRVEDCDAVRAVRRYRPEVVIGCWVTHKYRRDRHHAGGNSGGIVEEDVIAGCDRYVMIGNEQVHAGKSIWSLPHTIEYPPFVYSRAVNGTRDFVAVWDRQAQSPAGGAGSGDGAGTC